MMSSGCTSQYYAQNSNTNFGTSLCKNQCTNSYLNQNMNLCMNPYMSQGFMHSTNNLYVSPCIGQNMCGYINPCKKCCCCCCNCNCNNNYPGNGNGSEPVKGEIDGQRGPFFWHIEYNIDEEDFHKDYFYITVTFLGFKIIDTKLDVKHPTIDINLAVSGIGIKSQLGIDFDKRYVYLKGKLNFVYYTKDFNIILYEF